jgi:hypothetical protein
MRHPHLSVVGRGLRTRRIGEVAKRYAAGPEAPALPGAPRLRDAGLESAACGGICFLGSARFVQTRRCGPDKQGPPGHACLGEDGVGVVSRGVWGLGMCQVGEVSKINPAGPEAPALPGAPRH